MWLTLIMRDVVMGVRAQSKVPKANQDRATATLGHPWSTLGPASFEQSLNELLGGERAQIVHALANAHETQRNRFVASNGGDGSAFGGAVELGQDDSCHPQRLVESLHLRDRVLSGVGIQH